MTGYEQKKLMINWLEAGALYNTSPLYTHTTTVNCTTGEGFKLW